MRLLAAGELRQVVVPSVEEEALRDIVRAREDLRGDLMRARLEFPVASDGVARLTAPSSQRCRVGAASVQVKRRGEPLWRPVALG